MRFGEALIAAGLITSQHLEKALLVKSRHPHLSLGEVISKLFGVEREEIETHYLRLVIIPAVEKWIRTQIDQKSLGTSIRVAEHIDTVDLTIPAFTRYEGEAVSFQRDARGIYRENNSISRIERLLLTVDPLVVSTSNGKKVSLADVHLEITLENKRVRPDNLSLLAELKILLLQALREKV